MSANKLRVIFNSIPLEFKEQSVILDTGGDVQEMANDYVWIFAGGIAPNDFLKAIGIHFGPRDLTSEAAAEAAIREKSVIAVPAAPLVKTAAA
jgi:hypothetical protein